MSKRAINFVLLLVSIGIILFIVNAFYSAFTREPLTTTPEPTPSNTISGTIAGTTDATQTTSSGPSTSQSEEAKPTIDMDNASSTAMEMQESSNEEAGQALQANPALRDALPPIPEAPPPVTSSATITEATDSTPNAQVFRPINDNDEAIPLNTDNTSQSNNNGNFPAPSNTGNSNFPSPSTGSSRNSSSFPSPSQSNFPTPNSGGSNFPAPVN